MQLLGYASGDNHLYLVYEYVPNGTLSDHLQDPLLKGKILVIMSLKYLCKYIYATTPHYGKRFDLSYTSR